MKHTPSARNIAVDLNAPFVDNVGQVRQGQFDLWEPINERVKHIFTIVTPLKPLEVVDAPVNDSFEREQQQTAFPTLMFEPVGESTIYGRTPGPTVRDILRRREVIQTAVDTLSRSIHLIEEIDETGMATLQSHIDNGDSWFTKEGQPLGRFTRELPPEEAAKARALLASNVKRHEYTHFKQLIDPETAFWRELDLYWHSFLLVANPNTWDDVTFLKTFATLYTIPNRFVAEFFAMDAEVYTTAPRPVREVVKQHTTTQRGVETELFEILNRRNIDKEAFSTMLRSSVGERYCDLWLAYMLDRLRAGDALDDIRVTDFRHYLSAAQTLLEASARAQDAREELIDFIYASCQGPVFEVVRLRNQKGTFSLERSWFSLNPRVSGQATLLGVRQALYRRYVLSSLYKKSDIGDNLRRRETAIEQVIRGIPIDDTRLFDSFCPSPSALRESLHTAQTDIVDMLFNDTATRADLDQWLHDPEYKHSQQ